ncbi:MAG: hypothetical protein MUO23_00565 [Anaerolineales bacterium]|nr:hypothetical protein [Anaerolineales bacterium]
MPGILPEDLVLVAIAKHPRDLEIARLLGWYRIPLAYSPKTLHVEWLAFYQTAAFADQRWSVRWVAQVRGYELTTRASLLRAEPRHPRAEEPYFKLQLGPLEPLPHPIESRRWRRFTFLYTTGERLLAAQDLRQLVMTSARERAHLWRALRERRCRPAWPHPGSSAPGE